MMAENTIQKESVEFSEVKKYYLKKENKRILKLYGACIYRDYMSSDLNSASPNPLKNHLIDRRIRGKLIDWLFEVVYVMKCTESTIYLAISILDRFLFLFRAEKLQNEHIELIGVTCLSISSKIEDPAPLQMVDIRNLICHRKYTSKSLIDMERLILTTIDFQVYEISMLIFIQTYICEFLIANAKYFVSHDQQGVINEIQLFAIHISKVLLHSDEFSSFRNCIKSISCIVIAFDIVRTQRKMKKLDEDRIQHWILSMIESSGYDPADLNSLYNLVGKYYMSFPEEYPQSNLNKIAELPY